MDGGGEWWNRRASGTLIQLLYCQVNPSGARCHLSFVRFLSPRREYASRIRRKREGWRFKVGIVGARRLFRTVPSGFPPFLSLNPWALTGPAYYGAGIITVPRHISRMEIPRIVGDDDTEILGGIAPQCRVHRVREGRETRGVNP